MIKILFICHGNICRSVAAEMIMKKLVKEKGIADRYEIASAATSTEEIGNDIYPPMKRALTEYGIPFTRHAARQITRADYDRYDYIIGMDEENAWNLSRLFGKDPAGKVSSLMDWAGKPGQEVADPWYTRNFHRTLDDCLTGCGALLSASEEHN